MHVHIAGDGMIDRSLGRCCCGRLHLLSSLSTLHDRDFGNCLQAKDSVHKERQNYPSYGDCFGGYSDLEGNSDDSFPDINWHQKTRDASERAKERAVLSWFDHYSKHVPELPTIPHTLRHFLPTGH